MRRLLLVVVAVVGFWFFGACQQALPHRVEILGARPDFLLAFMTVLSLQTTRAGGTLVGFLGGLVHGALAGANLAHYVITRTTTCFGLSWVRSAGFEPGLGRVGLYAAVHVLVAQIMLMFLIAPQDIARFLGSTIGTAMYNGVLAIALYAPLKRVVGRPQR